MSRTAATVPARGDRIVLRGGRVFGDGTAESADAHHAMGARADVAIEGGVIIEVGGVSARDHDRVIDCTGRLVMPGFVDAHSHADGLLDDDSVQLSLLRQGVTTVVAGQDGVSYAPGDGVYAGEYFAAINGPHPTYPGDGVADYLASVDGASRLNAAYLIPAGTVRFQVCGRSQESADDERLAAMVALVQRGMDDGAVGLSTGLDYVPGLFQNADEIAALCEPVVRADGVYVTHMRGGYEANAAIGIEEIGHIARRTREHAGGDIGVHISHFHADADIVIHQLDALAAAGVDATFDAYPYTRGCSLLSMPLLPPELSLQPTEVVVRTLGDPGAREKIRRDWFPQVARNASLGPEWASMITLAHIEAPEYDWAHGLTIANAANRTGGDPVDLALDVLKASRLRVNAVMMVRNPRGVAELARIFADHRHIGGSDGIFIGAHPHPRARGTFARFLREYVRETGTWSWADAVRHLSLRPASRFRLGRRGVIAPGAVADVIVVDPGAVADTATYEHPLGEAVGIDDVLVAGVPVLAGGELLGARPGRGLRREGA